MHKVTLLPPVSFRSLLTGLGVLMGVLLLLCIYYYRHTILLPPSFIHAWTQSDRYALALGYLQNGFNLFLPQTFNLATKNGVTAADLPLAEYIVAILMKATGSTHPGIFRLFVLFVNLAGYAYLYALVLRLSASHLKAFIAAVFVFTVPVLTYYQAGFIPSSVSFPILLIAYYHFFIYKQGAGAAHFYQALLFATIAALVRLPFVIYLLAIVLHQATSWYNGKKVWRKELLPILFSAAVLIAYSLYKAYVGSHYGTAFLTKLLPAGSVTEAWQLLVLIYKRWNEQFLTVAHVGLLAVVLLLSAVSFLRNKTCHRILPALLFHLLVLAAGTVLYFLLMEQQFVDHEYYFIDCCYPFITLLLVAGLIGIDTTMPALRWATIGIALPLLIIAAIYAQRVQAEKYAYHNWDRCEVTRSNFEGSAALLDSLRIPANAKMLVIDAYSTNAALIQMNRRGYTVLHTTEENIRKGLSENFDYIVTQDIYFPSDVWYTTPDIQYRMKRLGGNRKISVYRWIDADSAITLHQLMGTNASPEVFALPAPGETNNWSPGGARYDSISGQLFVTGETEFGPGYSLVLVNNQPANWLVEATLVTNKAPQQPVSLALQVVQGDSTLFFAHHEFSLQPNRKIQTLAGLFKLPTGYKPGTQLKCFVWNQNHASLGFVQMNITGYD